MREALLSLEESRKSKVTAPSAVSIKRWFSKLNYNSIKQKHFQLARKHHPVNTGRKLYPAAPNGYTTRPAPPQDRWVRHMHTPSPTATTLISCILRPGTARWQCSIGFFRSHLATERFPHRNHAHLHPQTTVAVLQRPGIGLFRAPRQNMYVAPGAQEPLTVSLCEPSSAPPFVKLALHHLPLCTFLFSSARNDGGETNPHNDGGETNPHTDGGETNPTRIRSLHVSSRVHN